MPLSGDTELLIQELYGRAHLAMLNTLNGAAEKIFEESEKQVPKSEAHRERQSRPGYPAESLAERGRISRATPESPVAQVIYEGPYAAAQEVGQMTYESKGGKRVEWRAMNYTTPGTKSRYLEDPGKSVLAMVPEELAIQGKIAMGELPGLVTPQAELQAFGRQARQLPVPPTEIQQIGTKETTLAKQTTVLQRPSASESLFKE